MPAITYAVGEDGRIVHINNAERGSNRYTCLDCKETLTVRKGDINEHHFSHRGDSTCESSEHKAAKRMLVERLSELSIKKKCCDIRHTFPNLVGVEEVTVKPYRVDVGVLKDDVIVTAIEVYKTHKTEIEKVEFLVEARINYFEVEADDVIAAFGRDDFDLRCISEYDCHACIKYKKEVARRREIIREEAERNRIIREEEEAKRVTTEVVVQERVEKAKPMKVKIPESFDGSIDEYGKHLFDTDQSPICSKCYKPLTDYEIDYLSMYLEVRYEDCRCFRHLKIPDDEYRISTYNCGGRITVVDIPSHYDYLKNIRNVRECSVIYDCYSRGKTDLRDLWKYVLHRYGKDEKIRRNKEGYILTLEDECKGLYTPSQRHPSLNPKYLRNVVDFSEENSL